MEIDNQPFHTLNPQQVLELLESGPEGLSPSQVQERLGSFGFNELAKGKKISPLFIFIRQFANLLMLILIVAVGVSFMLGEHLDAWVILVIILACAVLGFIQEYRAERAAAALQKMAAPEATVIRESREQVVPAREVVPGDVLVLHTGDRVAADGRLLKQVNLKADEALLTGESTAVGKQVESVSSPETPVADRKCMVFGGTVITYGRGRAVVTRTGMDTEFGQVARMLEEVTAERTPLEKRMQTIGRVLGLICLGVAVGASLLGVFRGHAWLEMLIWGISLAVAAVPESLPAVVTGALAIGTTRMARRNAIVKRLPAVETMGCTTVICTDKTGTLTKNEMTARRVYLHRREIEVTGSGYEPQGQFLVAGEAVDPREVPVLELAARICILCNDAGLDDKDGVWSVRGDPTEGALVVLARKVGLEPERLSAEYPRVAEIPFSSETKRMSTIHQAPQGFLLCVKGAPEGLLPRCRSIVTGDGEQHLPEEDRDEIISQAARMAHDALRVLGLAYKEVEEVPGLESEPDRDLVWVGLVGLIDPARDEAPEAVRRCHEAGIRVIMVTGDHPDTAGAIAREVGLVDKKKSQKVVTGTELNKLSDSELEKTLRTVRVFARVAPEHKLRLISILKGQGEVVAMTGDGVNDAPALKRADIGVAMGITGTEVTKETAAMILADDNFATLVAAVEEGRAIFDNIKKYLIFLLSCNLAEILVLTSAIFIGLPLPLLALQILWVNLDSDGLPAFALGVDPKAPDIMRRPPRPAGEGVFTPAVNVLLLVISVYLCLILLPLFAYYVLMDPNRLEQSDRILAQAQTMVFVALILAEQVNAFNCRSDRHSLFTVGVFTNRLLLVSVTLSTSMLMAVIYWPPLATLFHTYPLDRGDWLIAAGLGLSIFPVVEVAKWIIRRSGHQRNLNLA